MDIRTFLYSWCLKRNIKRYVEVRATGIKSRQRFLCEIKLEGCPYIGCGNSEDSSDAEYNAAKDFVDYLVRQNMIKPSEIPQEIPESTGTQTDELEEENQESTEGITPSYEPGMELDPMAQAYGLFREDSEGDDEAKEEKKLREERENFDMEASVHGNWTIENAKSKLHQFLQQNNIKGDYNYSVVGTEGCKSFVAELSIYVKKLDRTLTGRESGSNKLIASKNCALSLVRQLYRLGVIDAFTGSLKATKDKETELPAPQVCISPELESEVVGVLKDLNIEPVRIDYTVKSEEPISIINTTVIDDFETVNPPTARVIAWSPPSTNWNPWLSCDISEGPFSNVSLDGISKNLEDELRSRLQEEGTLQDVILERKSLPIAACKKEIMDMINHNSVCIIRGNAGCGKTTQVGQFILDDYIRTGQGAHCNIIVTQPKRISAMSIADRVAYERGEALGTSVGYSVRFETIHPRPYGGILFCTVGTLLKKLENGLRGISHIIVDEVHERDINTDFILIVLRDMIHTYPDLRLILMSATMDTTLFSNYFDGCPVFNVPGQLFPVQVYYLEDAVELVRFMPSVEPRRRKKTKSSGRNLNDDDDEDLSPEDLEENLNLKVNPSYSAETKYAMSLLNEKEINYELIHDILKFIKNLKVNGAILIFLPGWSVIFSLMRHLQHCVDFSGKDYVILPLHSCLSTEDQKRVFENHPPNVTKVILSTNIAESSITINDVVFVIDSCKTKTKMFTTHNNLTHYTTGWASRTNLEQRKGRAGRVKPGYCFHLCSKARYESLEEYTIPEILRSPLHELTLSVKMLGLGKVEAFLSKALEPPPMDAVTESEAFLREMKYLDRNNELTPLGRIIGQLPIEPRLGRMLILGILFNCANPLTTIAANSTTFPGVFVNTIERRELSYQQKAFSGIRFSDHIATINAFQTWERAKKTGTDGELCGSKMLSEASLKLTADAKNQLLTLLTNVCHFPPESLTDRVFNYHGPDENLDMVIALLSVGLYPNFAFHLSKRKLLTTGNQIALINKRSVNCSNQNQNFPFPFFVYGEKIKTRAVACKQITMVTPLSLLLFGARKVEYVKGVVKLDGWLNVKMDPFTASSIVALRPALDSLIIKAVKEPAQIGNLSETDEKIIKVIKELCKFNAGRYGTAGMQSPTYQSRRQGVYKSADGKRLPDQCRRGGFRGRSGHHDKREYYRSFLGSRGRYAEPRRENLRDYHPVNYREFLHPRVPRDPRDGRGPREFRGARNMRGPRDFRGGRDVRAPRDVRDARDMRETREFRNSREQRDPRLLRNRRNAWNPIHTRNDRNYRNPRNARNFRQLRIPDHDRTYLRGRWY